MDALDESWVERKLLTATNTQESVQSLSMWALHHKTQHERIVGIWFRVLKAGTIRLFSRACIFQWHFASGIQVRSLVENVIIWPTSYLGVQRRVLLTQIERIAGTSIVRSRIRGNTVIPMALQVSSLYY
jgi:CID domain